MAERFEPLWFRASSDTRHVNMVNIRLQLAVLATTFLALFVSGCRETVTSAHSPTFASDGTVFAFVRKVRTVKKFEDRTVGQKIFLLWTPVREKPNVRSAHIDSIGLSDVEDLHSLISIAPDSRRALVLHRRFMSVVDFDSGSVQRLTDEHEAVTTAVWIDADSVGYVSHRKWRGPLFAATTDRSVWRVDLPTSESVRVLLHKGTATNCNLLSWAFNRGYVDPVHEYWSPDRKRLAFLTGSEPGKLQLLDIQTGVLTTVTDGSMNVREVAWDPRSERLLVAYSSEARTCGAFVFSILDNTQVDLGQRLESLLSECSVRAPSWTPDGQYIIINQHNGDGVLLRDKDFDVTFLGGIASQQTGWSPTELHALQKAGWVQVRGQGGEFAISYDGKTRVRLGPIGSICSPDGRWNAILDYNSGDILLSRLPESAFTGAR